MRKLLRTCECCGGWRKQPGISFSIMQIAFTHTHDSSCNHFELLPRFIAIKVFHSCIFTLLHSLHSAFHIWILDVACESYRTAYQNDSSFMMLCKCRESSFRPVFCDFLPLLMHNGSNVAHRLHPLNSYAHFVWSFTYGYACSFYCLLTGENRLSAH